MFQENESEEPYYADDDSFQESSIGEGDDDSLRLIAENLESQYSHNPDGTNTAYTVFLIVNAALGAGLLNFPKSYDDAGGIVVASDCCACVHIIRHSAPRRALWGGEPAAAAWQSPARRAP